VKKGGDFNIVGSMNNCVPFEESGKKHKAKVNFNNLGFESDPEEIQDVLDSELNDADFE